MRDDAIESITKSASERKHIGVKVLGGSMPSTPRSTLQTPNVTPSSHKRRRVTSTPIHHVHHHRSQVPKRKTSTTDTVDRVCVYLKQRQYSRVLRSLCKMSNAFQNALTRHFQKDIIREIKKLVHPKTNSVWRTTGKDKYTMLTEFAWSKIVAEAYRVCPTVMGVLEALLPASGGVFHRRKDMKLTSLLPNVGTIIGLIVFSHKPGTMKLLQEIVGVQLWLSGCARSAITRLNHLGMSLGTTAVQACVDQIRLDYDKELKALQHDITRQNEQPARRRLFSGCTGDDFENLVPLETEHADPDEDPDKTIPAIESSPVSHSNHDESMELNENTVRVPTGYTLVFDNINQKTRARYNSRDGGNTMLNMVQAYAAVDRVPAMHLDDTRPTAEDIRNIPMDVYIPRNEDVKVLRSEYKLEIERVLVRYMDEFSSIEVLDHIYHPYLTESKRKSHLIPLGVINKDETKIGDMIDIMESYQHYVPGGTEPVPVVLFGDGLSCERANDAQNARINGDTRWDRLQGLVPAIQEWHKRGIYLEDTYKLLYDAKSVRSTGTLYSIRNRYRHTNVHGNILQCFNHASDLLDFATDAYILAAANVIIKNLTPYICVETLFDETVASILDWAFNPMTISSETSKEQWCVCQTDDDSGDFIRCDNKKCDRGQWFHFSCVGLTTDSIPEGKWFCSPQCCSQSKHSYSESCIDHVNEYSKAVLWRGIGERVRRDALREADGNRIVCHWKFDMLDYYQWHHPKYFVVGHRLLSDLHGGASPRIAHQLRWNRTVNVRGGLGNNIEMDLQMEHFNKEYKEAVKDSGGHLSVNTVDRHSQMVGLKKQLSAVFDRQADISCKKGKRRPKDRDADVKKLTNELVAEGVFSTRLGRDHKAFEGFVLNKYFQSLAQFNVRLSKLSKRLAKRLDIAVT